MARGYAWRWAKASWLACARAPRPCEPWATPLAAAWLGPIAAGPAAGRLRRAARGSAWRLASACMWAAACAWAAACWSAPAYLWECVKGAVSRLALLWQLARRFLVRG